MSKNKLKAEASDAFLILSLKGFINDFVDQTELEERLSVLKRISNKSSRAYEYANQLLPNVEQGELTISTAQNVVGYLELIMRICDPDHLPSRPHIHDEDSGEKFNAFTGRGIRGSQLSQKEIVTVWNRDYRKIQEHLEELSARVNIPSVEEH